MTYTYSLNHNLGLEPTISVNSNYILISADDHDFARAINNRQQIDIGILGFDKALDKVPHLRLLHKFEYYGVTRPEPIMLA